LFDQGNGVVRCMGLPDEDAGEHETSYDRENHGLPEGSLESFEFQAVFVFLPGASRPWFSRLW
jgi:hypothetical protein